MIADQYQLDATYKTFPPFEEWAKTKFGQDRWNRYVKTLNAQKEGVTANLLAEAHEVVKRATAVDTGAIEGLYETDRGFTFTVAVDAAMWQAVIERDKGAGVRALIEAQVEAYEYVLNLATEETPISEAAIRKLHQIVCRSQDEYMAYTEVGPQPRLLPKGEYKTNPNHVKKADGSSHAYAPVDLVSDEMQRLCKELRSDSFTAAHPALQASYAHYAFVVIHPFTDGNGRVARALGSVFTYRAQSVPLLILSEQKWSYLNSLEAADGGNYSPFVEFILDSTLASMQLVEESIKTAVAPAISSLLENFESLNRTRSGYTHAEIDKAAQDLHELIHEEIFRFVRDDVGMPNDNITINIHKNMFGAPTMAPPKYRSPRYEERNAGSAIALEASTLKLPNNVQILETYYFVVPTDSGLEDDILMLRYAANERRGKSESIFNARISDTLPQASINLQMRVKIFVQGLVRQFLEKLYAATLLKAKEGL